MRNFIYIISEYNPPHKGHAYLISEARSLFPDSVVIAITSGHFTERGSPAVTDKFTRAHAAIEIGCDLVLSLPFPFSAASAENFARGGVHIAAEFARAFPDANHALVFGSECGDTDALRLAADRVSSEEFRTRLYERSRGGHNAREMQALYTEMYGVDDARIMDGANDALGIEYIRAISGEGDAPIDPHAVRRIGAAHDDVCPDGEVGYASASAIRSMISRGEPESANAFVTSAAWGIVTESLQKHGVADEERMGAAILTLLRMMTPEYADSIAECGGGVGRRLLSASLESGSYGEMLSRSATKQYTNARLRRAALFASLGVDSSAFDVLPQYTQLLAANSVGISVLHDYDGTLPVLTKFADGYKLPDAAQIQLSLESRADRLYTLAFDPALSADTFLKMSPWIEKK